MKSKVYTEKAPEPIGPYSQAVSAGSLLFTAGQIGLNQEGRLVDGVVDQTRQAMINLKAVLEAGGSGLEHVVKTTIFLVDFNDFASVNEVYAEYFDETPPARSTVEVRRLPKDARVEIEMIGLIPS